MPTRGAPDVALFSVPLVKKHKGSSSSELGPYLNDLLIAVIGLDALGRQRVTVARPVGHHGEGFPHGLQDTERAGTETGLAGTAPPASCDSAEERAAPSTAQGTRTEASNKVLERSFPAQPPRNVCPLPASAPELTFPAPGRLHLGAPAHKGTGQRDTEPVASATSARSQDPHRQRTFCFTCLSPGRSFGSVSLSTFTLS